MVFRDDWDNTRIAVVICDMWDSTQCVSAARRVVEMAPRVNEVVARLRRDDALIVHAPAGCIGIRQLVYWGKRPCFVEI